MNTFRHTQWYTFQQALRLLTCVIDGLRLNLTMAQLNIEQAMLYIVTEAMIENTA